jgi:hypothetical protein
LKDNFQEANRGNAKNPHAVPDTNPRSRYGVYIENDRFVSTAFGRRAGWRLQAADT